MGGNRRRRRKANADGDEDVQQSSCLVRIESSTTAVDDAGDAEQVWTVNFVRSIEKKSPQPSTSADATPSVMSIGLQIVRGTIDKLTSRNQKKTMNKTDSVLTVKPTPIQLRLWPTLLNSFESKSCINNSTPLNVVGIAPTGTGKTISYVVPIISQCVCLLCEAAPARVCQLINLTNVHGLVLVPTRELAIQVSKEFHLVAKIANKYLAKYSPVDAESIVMRVESIAVYGGVDIESQVESLMGKNESSLYEPTFTSLVVAATAGRLLDILKDSSSEKVSVASVFSNLQAIVFDEADRMAVNTDMAAQVEDILSILRDVQVNSDPMSGDFVSCLVSATLPNQVQEMCEKWVPRSRVVVKADYVTMENKQSTNLTCKSHTSDDNEESLKEDEHIEKKNSEQNLDLSSIPSNIVQTLHVCSNHKKPKKLIITLQRIYKKQNEGKVGRFTVNNRLSIVFFAQIKTLKYVSKLLIKEGLRCVELYGSLNQMEREKRLLEFKSGKIPILLATDIAARGIHVNNVNYVINYDFPSSLDQYIHRCGRAGRKEALKGETSEYPPTVYSFFTREYSAMAVSVVDLLKSCKAWIDPNLIALIEENKDGKKKRKRRDESTENATGAGEIVGDDDSDSDNNQFSFLGKIVLKRALHVSDAGDSDDDDDETT